MENQTLPHQSLPQHLREDGIYVSLTASPLDVTSIISRVKTPKAGAVVLFAGTARDNIHGTPVIELYYEAYVQRALKTMLVLSQEIKQKHSLTAISLEHRLGVIPIGDECILIAVSAPHRQAAWKAGEEALEKCKEKVEIWKREDIGDAGGQIWRANREEAVEPKKLIELY